MLIEDTSTSNYLIVPMLLLRVLAKHGGTSVQPSNCNPLNRRRETHGLDDASGIE